MVDLDVIIDTIKTIVDERVAAKIHPEFCTLDALIDRIGEGTLKTELRQLYNDGRIKLGRTINGFYFKKYE